MNDSNGHALYTRFLRGLESSGGRVAIRIGSESMTYEAVHELAMRWAGSLLAASEQAPRAVGVLADKGVESYVGILAALYVGATVVPLHPDFPVSRTRRMLELAGVSAVVADQHGLAVLDEVGSADLLVLAPGSGQGGRRIATRSGDALDEPRPVAANDAAYVLFTSGSTGRPKGVTITHANTRHYFGLLDERYDFGPDDVFSQTFDLNFDCAMFDLFCAWGAGASVHPVPPHAYRDLPGFVAERNLTVWFSAPSTIALVRRLGGLTSAALPALRWSLFAGEALRCVDAAAWQAAAPASTVENLYGPTELTVTISGHRWAGATSAARAVNGIVPIGAINSGHDHLLLTEDDEESDTEGELCVTGPQLTPGYLDPADERGRFLDHDSRRWYRTGDRVRRLADGELVYLGRLDSQVQVQGWRVELAEVDDALRRCAGVDDAVTVTRPVDDGLELVAFYTGTPSAAVELARQLRRTLPHGAVPRHYRHVDVFPLNSNRKIDRGRLASAAAELTAVGG